MWNTGHSWYEEGDAHVVDWTSIMEESTDESGCSDESDHETNASAKKIHLDKPDNDRQYSPTRAIVEIALLQQSFKSVTPICITCSHGNLTLEISQHIGLATEIFYVCSNQDCSKNEVSKAAIFSMASKQEHRYDINKSLVLAMRDIGQGHRATKRLVASLGLPEPLSHPPIAELTREWYEHSLDECEESMKAAAEELKAQLRGNECGDEESSGDEEESTVAEEEEDGSVIMDCSVKIDGSWMTRGRHSCMDL